LRRGDPRSVSLGGVRLSPQLLDQIRGQGAFRPPPLVPRDLAICIARRVRRKWPRPTRRAPSVENRPVRRGVA
jgi:hypothetical protein